MCGGPDVIGVGQGAETKACSRAKASTWPGRSAGGWETVLFEDRGDQPAGAAGAASAARSAQRGRAGRADTAPTAAPLGAFLRGAVPEQLEPASASAVRPGATDLPQLSAMTSRARLLVETGPLRTGRSRCAGSGSCGAGRAPIGGRAAVPPATATLRSSPIERSTGSARSAPCAPSTCRSRSGPGPRRGGRARGRHRGQLRRSLAPGRTALAGGCAPAAPGLHPGERAERMRLVGAVSARQHGRAGALLAALAAPRLPARLVSAILEQTVPQPPAEPNPAQYWPSHGCTPSSPPPANADHVRPAAHRTTRATARPCSTTVSASYALTSTGTADTAATARGRALDCFVSAYAGACGARDTPAFRRQLSAS